MKSTWNGHAKRGSWVGPMVLLGVAAATGLWLWQTQAAYVPLLPAIGVVALMAIAGGYWFYRVRAARRLFTVLDAYAERELARRESRPQHGLPRPKSAYSQSNV